MMLRGAAAYGPPPGSGAMDKHQKSLFDFEPAPWQLDEADDRMIVSVVLPEPPYGPLDYSVPEAR
jgi:hypothetical protein